MKDGDNFLLDFIKNKRWVDKEEEEEAADDNTKGHNLDKSLDKVERTDAFGEKFNFRFEDEAASSVPLSSVLHSNNRYLHGLFGICYVVRMTYGVISAQPGRRERRKS